MSTFKEIEQNWTAELHNLYDSREARTMFQFALEDVCGFSRTTILTQTNDKPSKQIADQLNEFLQQLQTGKPYQYLTGFTYFDGLKIGVNASVLIPRPETEELVDWVSNSLPSHFSGIIEDWCSGSGCITIALKKRVPFANVIGYELSESALETSRMNAHELQADVEFKSADALNISIETECSVIVSNPPYIPENEQNKMRENVVKFEPEMALFVSDTDPLIFYRTIAQNAIKRLVPGGFLFFELHEDFAFQTKELVEQIGFKDVELKQDLQEKWRMLKAVKP